jgi:LysM repeat protein
MATVTYTVKKGDTLSEIAKKYNTTVSELTKLNNISNPNYIVVGQVLIISGDESAPEANRSNRPIIELFGLQSKTDRTVFATWSWDRYRTAKYETKWVYYTGDGVGWIEESSTTYKQASYTAPDNADRVAFYVRPISEQYTIEHDNGKESYHSYWTAEWSTVKIYHFKDNPPSTPPAPSVEIEDYKLTAKLDNLDVNATKIQFQIVKDDSTVFKTGKASIKTTNASYSCIVEAGSEYKVRCRSIRDDLYSEWSEYSDNVKTSPSAPSEIESLKALTKTSIYLSWSKVANAENYNIEYATEKRYFDSSGEVKSTSVESVVRHAEITGLETGKEWFFRVRAVNDVGSSAWTNIKSIKLGEAPDIPTTWCSTTTVMVGEPLTLYWVHNSEDGSSQTYAQLELTIGNKTTIKTIENSTDEDEKDKTSFYVVNTSGYSEGTKIQWRVKTRGITDDYSDWSIQRTIDIYAPPTLELSVNDSNGALIDSLESFPLYISALAGPNTQTPIGYHLSVVANETYETTDYIGNSEIIKSGDEVYSRYFDTNTLSKLALSAGDLNLDNNISYTVVCTVSMDSGLTAEASYDFTVAWADMYYAPSAEISYDSETYTANIRPYCETEYGQLIEGLTLSVYRREFDGTYTELATGLDNESGIFITDPHPALDYARYRVVAVNNETGAVSYTDVPGFPIGEKAVIIQWDEKWTNFDVQSEEPYDDPTWAGSLLRLPYNIDVSDKYNPDVELIEYIGRRHPVTYYGTQLGESSTWSVAIAKSDKETLYALRRLAIWMDNVYVREPSGSGYWAKVDVSFSQKHCDLTIPVSIGITRVEGGA